MSFFDYEGIEILLSLSKLCETRLDLLAIQRVVIKSNLLKSRSYFQESSACHCCPNVS